MSGHRIELRATFTVGAEGGREEAEAVIQKIKDLRTTRFDSDGWPSDFEVWGATVDGNSWHEKWPPRTPEPTTRELAEQALQAAGFDTRTIEDLLRREGD